MGNIFSFLKQNWLGIVILTIIMGTMIFISITLAKISSNASQNSEALYPCETTCTYNINESKWCLPAAGINRRFATKGECLKFCTMWNRIKG